MSIHLNSRYAGEKVVRALAADGVRRPTVFRTPPEDWEFGYEEHLVVDGDRLDLIADNAYGDPRLWWVIASVNPELDVPEPLVPGVILRVPRAG